MMTMSSAYISEIVFVSPTSDPLFLDLRAFGRSSMKSLERRGSSGDPRNRHFPYSLPRYPGVDSYRYLCCQMGETQVQWCLPIEICPRLRPKVDYHLNSGSKDILQYLPECGRECYRPVHVNVPVLTLTLPHQFRVALFQSSAPHQT